MDRAARRFASWVLGLHLLGLLALILIVVYASVEVYSRARRQALDQLKIRQELLAAQAARGIETFYAAVADDLELPARIPAGSVAADVVRATVWEQLRGRATCLVEVDVASLATVAQFSDDAQLDPKQLIRRAGEWVKSVQGATIGQMIQAGPDKSLLLIATPVPSGTKNPHVLVAAIPMRSVETRFLNDLNEPKAMAATLTDDQMNVLSSDLRDLVGTNVKSEQVDPRLRAVADQYVRQGHRGTREFLEPMSVGGVKLDPMMITIQPVDMPDGKKWWLGVSSDLEEVDQVVGQFFRRAAVIGGLVIFIGTAILVSTSTQLIRGRLRLERVQREMLSRELNQAREIQLMWLPERQETRVAIDVAAINRPASHVSGDFYNWFEMPASSQAGNGSPGARTCVVIGDVTGHGLPAAFLMATTQLLVKAMIVRIPDPGECLREVNRQLCQHVFSGQFVTLLIVIIDPATGRIELATAGHPPPIVGTDESFAALDVQPQLVLAVDDDVPYTTQRFQIGEGASLLLYTDGVTDVENPAGDRLEMDRLQSSLFGRFKDARTIVDAVLDAVDAFRGPIEPKDDLTVVALRLAPATPPEVQPDLSPSRSSAVPLTAKST